MDVVFKGRFDQETPIQRVFEHILELALPGETLLRITSVADPEINGKLLVKDAQFITGALMADDKESYEALKELVLFDEADFAYLLVGPRDSIDMEQTLNIEIGKILPLLPALPDTPNALFDEKALLDKVFQGGKPTAGAAPPEKQAPPPPSRPGKSDAPVVETAPTSFKRDASPKEPLPKRLIEREPDAVTRSSENWDLSSLRVPPKVSDLQTAAAEYKHRPKSPPPRISLLVLFVAFIFALEVMTITFWRQVSPYWKLSSGSLFSHVDSTKAHATHPH